MNMQMKVSVSLQTDKSFIRFLSELAKMTEDEVVCTLYDLANPPLKNVLSEDFKHHWSRMKARFPGTTLDLFAKAKFSNPIRNNKKSGNVTITFEICKSKKVVYSEEEISALAIEKILLKKPDGDSNAVST